MVNNIMTRPGNRILFNNTTNGLSTNNDDEWVQLGEAIKGKAAEDYFGWSIATSKSGEFVIIGGPWNGDNGANAGIAQVYKYIKDTDKWEKVGGDILGEKAGDLSGSSVDINDAGDVVIIGSLHNDKGTGHARVFRLMDGQWNQQGQDLIGTSSSWFGSAVAISSNGGKVIVGGPRSSEGYVAVYEYIADIQRWEQVGDSIVGEAASDRFGWSVDMDDSGDLIIVGAPYSSRSGYARVYRNVDGQWIKQGQDLDSKSGGEYFGRAVAISDDGKKVIIGDPGHDANGYYDSGYAQVYEFKDDTQKWEQVGSDITGEETDYLGSAVDINSTGDKIIVGAPAWDVYYIRNKPGYARIFRLLDSQWVQQGQDLDGRFSYDEFGGAVAISGDGEKVVIGAPYNDDNGSNSGHVRAFIFNKPSTAQPSSTPSIQPSSPNVPTMAPSISDYPTPSPFCLDSPLKILTSEDKGVKSARSCEFIAKRRERFCWKLEMKTHCPYTCGGCEKFRFSDSKGSFVFEGKVRDCKWLRESNGVIKASRLCQIAGIHKTCRKTCGLFVQECECECCDK